MSAHERGAAVQLQDLQVVGQRQQVRISIYRESSTVYTSADPSKPELPVPSDVHNVTNMVRMSETCHLRKG